MSTALKVSEVSAASPDMEDAQFNELVEDIRKHGQLVPIWKSGDEIIDGRKRARACSILGIPLKAVNVPGDGDPEALSYSLNILRTHYSVSQRAMVAAKRVNIRRGDIQSQKPTDCQDWQPLGVNEAARQSYVSHSNVSDAKRILNEAAPEVVVAVEAGELNIPSAMTIVKDFPRSAQAKALTEKLAIKKDSTGRRQSSQLGTHKASPRRAIADRMSRTLDQLENAVELLGDFVDETGTTNHAEYPFWLKRISKARTSLSRIINNQGGHDE